MANMGAAKGALRFHVLKGHELDGVFKRMLLSIR